MKEIAYVASLTLVLLATAACIPCMPGASSGPTITGITWQWEQLVETMPASQSVVPDPHNYTLVLQPDGNDNVKADCNLGMGAYKLSGSNLTLKPGPMTLAECGPDSSYSQYLRLLEQVQSYAVENGRLVLNLKGNAGKMFFGNAGPAQ